MIWKNCLMTNVYFDNEDAVENEPCVVKIEGDSILVEYEDEDAKGKAYLVQWTGTQQGGGHYVLTCPGEQGKSTLHGFTDGKLLEGFWIEHSERGMWRIELKP